MLMKLDIKKVLKGSLIFVGLGLILVILSLIFQILTLIITEEHSDVVHIVALVYAFSIIPLFLAMFFLAGVRAVKKHGLDAVGAGLVSAFSYTVVALAHLFFDFLLNLLVVSGLIPGGAGFGSSATVLAGQVFGDVTGPLGLGAALFCGSGLIAVGALINFVVGGLGGLFAQRR
jgi:hypothetical protein